jgi:hypothetical protein
MLERIERSLEGEDLQVPGRDWLAVTSRFLYDVPTFVGTWLLQEEPDGVSRHQGA